MKKFAVYTLLTFILCVSSSSIVCAQEVKDNAQLSKELGQQISIINAEIKTLKAKLKAEPSNADYVSEKAKKEGELRKATEQKKIIDTAIKAEKMSKKETQQAEKAQKKHENATKEAERIKSSNPDMAGKSNEGVSDELGAKIDVYKAEVKALKARKKVEPNNTNITGEVARKEAELKELKRQKKVIDTAIKTEKTSKKETRQAEKAQKKHEKAAKNAEEMKSTM